METTITSQDWHITRMYPLRGYIQGMLTHTTAWDQHSGGDETLKKKFLDDALFLNPVVFCLCRLYVGCHFQEFSIVGPFNFVEECQGHLIVLAVV